MLYKTMSEVGLHRNPNETLYNLKILNIGYIIHLCVLNNQGDIGVL